MNKNNLIQLTEIIKSNIKLLNYYKSIFNKINDLESNIFNHIKDKNDDICNLSNIINTSFNYHQLIFLSK